MRLRPAFFLGLLFSAYAAALALPGCGRAAPPEGLDAKTIDASTASARDTGALTRVEASSALSSATFAELSKRLSEPDRPFFSDNYVSNETSYLHVAEGLETLAESGGAYIGVGPEQTFSYLALLRPKLAFVVDLRRGNLVLHLLYKALFQEATSRSHFLALLVGRPYDEASQPGPAASVSEVIRHAEKRPPSEAVYASTHERLVRIVEESLGGRLDPSDAKRLATAHRAFFDGQLDLAFALKEKNGRAYPKLRELLVATDRSGRPRGFLATEGAFRFVATMQKENRVVPVVGDLAGAHALPSIAATLRERGLFVNALYVSNVEQYLFAGDAFAKWTKNVSLLPTNGKSLILRAYLDQGKRHPLEVDPHRTVSLLQRTNAFLERGAEKPYTSFWELANAPGPE